MIRIQKIFRNGFYLIIVTLALFACRNKPSQILKAQYFSRLGNEFTVELFADSTYLSTAKHLDDTIVRQGRYKQTKDIIVFGDTLFPLRAKRAIIKNGMLEFADLGVNLEIISSTIPLHTTFNRDLYADYYLFEYHPKLYGDIFEHPSISYNLNQEDIKKVDEILSNCISNLKINSKEYIKQCMAAINKDGQKEVWVNFVCKENKYSTAKYRIIEVHDGGDCYLNLKINLTTRKCYDIYINGEA